MHPFVSSRPDRGREFLDSHRESSRVTDDTIVRICRGRGRAIELSSVQDDVLRAVGGLQFQSKVAGATNVSFFEAWCDGNTPYRVGYWLADDRFVVQDCDVDTVSS
jgi:hypothetical protein